MSDGEKSIIIFQYKIFFQSAIFSLKQRKRGDALENFQGFLS
jgi:hypothetical protein